MLIHLVARGCRDVRSTAGSAGTDSNVSGRAAFSLEQLKPWQVQTFKVTGLPEVQFPTKYAASGKTPESKTRSCWNSPLSRHRKQPQTHQCWAVMPDMWAKKTLVTLLCGTVAGHSHVFQVTPRALLHWAAKGSPYSPFQSTVGSFS